MINNMIKKSGIRIRPIVTSIYIPPMVWKGDPLGHIGLNDTFFWVLEGECFLRIGSEYSVIHAGQLAFLPKGKMRSYTQTAAKFSMYEISFSATIDENNLMNVFGMSDGDYVVSIDNREEMNMLFEKSYREEMNKNPIHDIAWCANILDIINIYCEHRQKHSVNKKTLFKPVVKYMEKHLDEQLKVEELAAIIYMEPTYFIRKFKNAFGVPPLRYFIQMRMYKAMEYLLNSDLPVEEISNLIGISDSAYFSRLFKKIFHTSPSEYRKAFKSNLYYNESKSE